MEIEYRLAVLDEHLDLLVDATPTCKSLTGESVWATLFLIQQQVQAIRRQYRAEQEKSAQNFQPMSAASPAD
ncbi:MAG: hypothetical protein EOO68_26250 [Moraxellaceae bacterium]|nr:MAG: hypothetical protein EOO68_26250 [Moraxellaceae bacterium]